MAKYITDEGDEVEVDFTPDQVKELQVKAAELEEKAKKVDELQSTLAEKENELSKFESKDFNFSSLRKASAEQKEEMLKEFSDKEKTLIREIANMKNEQDEYKQKILSTYEDDVISALAGDNTELRTKLKEQAKEFVGDPVTQDDIYRRYKNAYTLIEGKTPNIDPVRRYTPTSTSQVPSPEKPKGFTETDEGKAAYRSYFPDSPYAKDNK